MKQLISLKPYTMFRMGGQARYFFEIKSEADLEEALSFVKQNKLPIFVLGGGSNILLSHDDIFEAAVLKMEILGFQVLSEDNDKVVIKIGAGENWDSVVAKTVEKHWLGLEALSAIPGTVGGTPIQNVGAYGAEISDVLISLEAYEIATGEMRTLTNEQCEFKYRDSVFKQQAKDKFVITSVTLELKKLSATQQVPIPNYPGVTKYLESKGITQPTQLQIREAIIDIRSKKLPDPKDIPSVGSFFKNPIVNAEQYEKLKAKYPDVKAFPKDSGDYKISAGWLLEASGYKGKTFGNLQFYENNALVITNIGEATFAELEELVKKTKAHIKQAFDIDLEVEPIIV